MIGKVIVALLSSEKIRVDKGGKPTTIKAEMYNPIGVVGAFAGFDVDAKRRIFEHLSDNATHPGYDDGYLMVTPEKANLVVRIMHKGVLSVKRQPRFRLVTKMKDFVGPTIPVERSPLDSTLGRGVPTDMNLQRLQFGGRPEKIPGNANLEPFDEVELPIMRSPTITSIVTEVDGFEEHFIEKDDTYSSRYSEQSERLTFKAPLTQLPFNNPLGGPEPILDEAYEGPMDVQTLLTMSMNPPATDIEWTTEISPELPEKKEWFFGTWESGSFPSVVFGMGGERVLFREKNELASAWILLSGKNADGEIKMILSVFNDLEGLLNLYPSVESHKTKAEKHGLNSLAMVEQIETKTKGKGLGQAAYLKAAEIVSKKFGGAIATGNHSLDAEKAWRGVFKHLPEGYKIIRWGDGNSRAFPEWEDEDPLSYSRLLWYDGPLNNPPTENWSAHRQRVPWDFAPNAFGRGSAFRTFKMDDPTSRRKAIHMDGWNRRYDKYKGVQAIAGRLLNGKWHIQSIRVPRKYKLRRTLKEVRLDRKRPPKWYKELHPEAKPFGTKKKNPLGVKIIDLSNLSPSLEEGESLEVFTDGQPSKNKFSPMFVSPISAKKASPTDSVHLVVPGLMPAPQEGWKKYRRDQIFYMPNDVKPHFHGAATHHLGDGFALNRASS